MKILFTLLTLSFATSSLYGQKIKTPKTIDEAIEILRTDFSDSLKQVIRNTPNDKLIDFCDPGMIDYYRIFRWIERDNKRSKIRKHLIKNGINNSCHQRTVILLAFKLSLNGDTIDENAIFKPYQRIENKWRAEDEVRFTTDTLRGVYIPKDLEDCFRQIDSFWADSTKNEIKTWTEKEFSAQTHMGFGLWMRNNWQLWGGSRLSKYFNEKGLFHPDDISGVILLSYHRWLNGREIKLEEQIKSYQDYWKDLHENK